MNDANLHAVPTRPAPRSGSTMDRPVTRDRRGWWLIGAAAVITLGVGLTLARGWLADGGRSLQVGHEQVSIATVTRGMFEDFIPVRGRVVPRSTVFLDAVEGGRVEAVLVEDGATVEAGQVLVRLSNAQLQLDVIAREAEVTQQLNNLDTLRLQLAQNRLSHRRTLIDVDYQIRRLSRLAQDGERMISDGYVSQREFDDSRDELAYQRALREVTLEAQATDESLQEAQLRQLTAAAEQLRANLRLARENLANLEVRAPVAGQLTAFDVEVGQSLARGERIGHIDDPDRYKLSALIDEFYLPRVDIALPASAEVDGQKVDLRITKIYPQVTNGQFEVDLSLSGDTPPQVRRGQTLQTRLQLGDPSQALLIPNGTYYQDTGGNWVFVITADGTTAARRAVRLGRRNAQHIEVLDGLQPGERVIVSPYTGFLAMDRLVLAANR
ncbi:MAG: efflux RND transporter periplasmic adaptor subunit [Pseudomonadota bacterium]